MAEVVVALGLPHTPVFPMIVAREGAESETAKLFAKAQKELVEARPDLIVIFDTDHLNTFFFDNLPIFAIGTSETFTGPCDEVEKVPSQTIQSDRAFAGHMHASLADAGFDLASLQEYHVDHSVMVPLYFMTPNMHIPVVPVFISGHVPPLPSAKRCLALGEAVRKAIESYPGALRVAIIGTGSFSLEVHGPRMEPGKTFGVPDRAWSERVQKHLEDGAVDTLIAESTPAQFERAGNVGGEVLNWIAMLGVVGKRKADWMAGQHQFGHAYGAWRGSKT